MRNHARYEVACETETAVTIRDVGPWSMYPTVTNDAEGVVEGIAPRINGKRLLFYDSDG